MFTGKQSILIYADRKDVYQIASTYPFFVRFFKPESRIIEQNNYHTEVEVHAKWFGFYSTQWRGVGRKEPDSRIFFTQSEGLFKGLTADWQFGEHPKGTIATITTQFEKAELLWLGETLLGNLLVERTTKKILTELKHAVEKKRKTNS